MRHESIVSLIKNDSSAKAYFDSLPSDTRSAAFIHGAGICTLGELKNYAQIFEGCR